MRNTQTTIGMLILALAPAMVNAAPTTWLRVGIIAKPAEVARGRGFIIHALPNSRKQSLILFRSEYMLLHTSIPDGKLKVLLSSGENVRYSPPMGINRTYFENIQLCGVICKKHRLFVLTSHAHAAIIHTPGAPKTPTYLKPQYRLTLYDARDGEPLYRLNLLSLKVKDRFTETYEAGPMRWVKGQVRIQNLTIAIHRDQLSIVKPEK